MNWRFEFEAIGTNWTIDVVVFGVRITKEDLLARILSRIEEFDKNYSRFRNDSLVTRMANNRGIFKLPDDAEKLFEIYANFYELTKGVFTPLIGKTMEEAGYDAGYSLIPNKLSTLLKISDVYAFRKNEIEMLVPHVLDFGAAGKGYLVDIISELLLGLGIDKFCIDAGSDILTKNFPVIEIALENPLDTTQAIGIAKIKDQSLCASATNRRKWSDMNHIINGIDLLPAEEIIATWATANEAIIADAVTTALFFTDPEVLLPHYSFEYLILYKDYSIKRSAGFPAEVFIR